MCEGPHNGRIYFGAVLGADDKRIARRMKIIRRYRVMQYGEPPGRDALLHKMLFHGVRNRDQVRLMAMPRRGGEPLDVANRRWTADLAQPAAPPTGGGKGGLHNVGSVLLGSASKGW